MFEVQQVRPVEVRFHLMSLYLLNRDRDISQEYRARIALGRNVGRVVMAAAGEHGEEVLSPLYTALGRRIHNERREPDRDTLAEALAEVGLSSGLLAAADSEELDGLVEASHTDGQQRVGLDVGTPIISVEGVSFFGPVVTPAPVGEEAGKLWDGVVLVAATPGFYELKRTREERPRFDVGAAAVHSGQLAAATAGR